MRRETALLVPTQAGAQRGLLALWWRPQALGLEPHPRAPALLRSHPGSPACKRRGYPRTPRRKGECATPRRAALCLVGTLDAGWRLHLESSLRQRRYGPAAQLGGAHATCPGMPRTAPLAQQERLLWLASPLMASLDSSSKPPLQKDLEPLAAAVLRHGNSRNSPTPTARGDAGGGGTWHAGLHVDNPPLSPFPFCLPKNARHGM
jgi:hypothetical protein